MFNSTAEGLGQRAQDYRQHDQRARERGREGGGSSNVGKITAILPKKNMPCLIYAIVYYFVAYAFDYPLFYVVGTLFVGCSIEHPLKEEVFALVILLFVTSLYFVYGHWLGLVAIPGVTEMITRVFGNKSTYINAIWLVCMFGLFVFTLVNGAV